MMHTVLWHGTELTSMHPQVRGYPTLQLHHNGAMVEAYRGANSFSSALKHIAGVQKQSNNFSRVNAKSRQSASPVMLL